MSRSDKSIRLDEVDQAGLYIVERNKEGYRVRRILAINIYARGFIPSSCCCVRYSNADIESWVSCVEFVDGASEDAIASPKHNDATADRKISQRNMKWRFGCQPAQIETNALLKGGLIETRLYGAHFTTTNHHHRSSHTHAPTQPEMVRPPTLTKLLTCSHHQLVNVVVLPLLRIMKLLQPPSPHLPLLSGTTMTWLKLRMISKMKWTKFKTSKTWTKKLTAKIFLAIT